MWLAIPVGPSEMDLLWNFYGNAPDKLFWVGLDFQFDESERSTSAMQTNLAAFDTEAVPEQIHHEEYGDSVARFYIKREVSTVENAIDGDEIIQWGRPNGHVL